jgi:hypothetical protein
MTSDDVKQVIFRLDLVENISLPRMLKVSGEDIQFGTYTDEFCRMLITEIPNFYKYLKMVTKINPDKITESGKAVIEDTKDYIEHLEALLAIYLDESKCKQLVQPQEQLEKEVTHD